MVKFFVIGFALWLGFFAVGAFGWSQIIGSLQNWRTDKPWLIRIILWAAILIGVFFLAHKYFWDYKVVYIIAMVLSFLGSCRKQT